MAATNVQQVRAPWTDEEVLLLLDHQTNPHLHPYTCGGDHETQVVLVATRKGWVCPALCGYTQDWAWLSREPHRSACNHCDWESPEYPTENIAGCAATWHVYEKHPDVWLDIIGDRPPNDPRPETLLERCDPAAGIHSMPHVGCILR